jgi:serine/threonine protein kinase
VDFGGVRDTFRAEGGSTVVGTFGYMAPEQLYGMALPATDLFALGMTIASLATGLEPEQIPRHGLRLDLEPLFPSGSGRLIELLQGMTEPDPERRFRDTTKVLEFIDEHRLTSLRAAAISPSLSVAATLDSDAGRHIARVAELDQRGCILELDLPLEESDVQIALSLLIDEVELDGIDPLRLRGHTRIEGGQTRLRFRTLTRFEKRWLRGAAIYAQLQSI